MGKKIKPDDYFRAGPFEGARFGKTTILRSNWNEKDHARYLDKLIERLPLIEKDIDGLISEVVGLILGLPPLELLYRAFWQMAANNIGIASESEGTKDSIRSVQTLEFIQNILASNPPLTEHKEEVSESDLKQITKIIGNIYDKLNSEYLMSCRAKEIQDDEIEDEINKIRQDAITHWVNVRGERYTVHERQHFEDLLSGQDELIQAALGVSSLKLIEGFSAIVDALTFGLGDAMQELREAMRDLDPEFLLRASKNNPKSDEEARSLMRKVIEEKGMKEKMSDLHERAFGVALFDVENVTGLPSSLLETLSWGLGEETVFFSDGDFKGWPVKTTPISSRPLIKIDGHYYCFCLYALCDNFYRIVEKLVKATSDKAVNRWNENQSEITESLPIHYLQKLLHSSESYQSVYYKWYPKEGIEKRSWCEIDGLVACQDHLIVIEVKAPAFSSQSPFDRFDTHVDSIRKLIGDPIRQGARFVDYLKHNDEVKLYDKAHKGVGTLKWSDFRKITICALSIDPNTEIASKAHRLQPLGIDTGALPIWAISLDDLRVCSEVFTDPLVFLHFLEKRTKASQELNVDLDDELDHVGLYFEHNDYTMHASEMGQGLDRLKFTGYRAIIDEFFSDRLLDPEKSSPCAQKIPPIFGDIFKFLLKGGGENVCEISSFLLDLAGDAREGIQLLVEQTIECQSLRGRVNFGTMNGDVDLTIACWQPELFLPEKNNFLDHAKTELVMSGRDSRMLLELTFEKDRSLKALEWRTIFLADIPDAERESYSPKIEDLKARRLQQSLINNGKTGRNEKCPCGSGNKLKKCCL